MSEWFWLIPIPFIASFSILLLLRWAYGWKFEKKAGYIALAASAITFLLSISAFLSYKTPVSISFDWFSIAGFPFQFGVWLDPLSVFFSLIVSFASLLVMLYSIGYMQKDDGLQRYFAELSLFAGAMLGLVLSDSLIQLFFFWELVGLSSYLLIGFWYFKPEARKAARKAFTTIVFGDAMFFAGIVLLANTYHSFQLHELISLASANPQPMFSLGMLLVLVAVLTKSAQFPFFSWLPDAMEGPTPVSTLLHSATMVKAGVFLLLRAFPLFLIAGTLPLIAFLGAVTALVGALGALSETNIKRVLAYSTISNLGLMVSAIGMGAIAAASFHVLNHMFFKALLFMIAGILLHWGFSDLKQGTTLQQNKLLWFSAILGALALGGFPLLNGFFSKEGILSAAFETNPFYFLLLLIVAFLSALYAFRWMFSVMQPSKHHGESEPVDWKMIAPIPLLLIGVLFSGYFGASLFHFLQFPEPAESLIPTVLSVLLTAIALVFSYLHYFKKSTQFKFIFRQPIVSKLQQISLKNFYVDALFSFIATQIIISVSFALYWIDQKIFNRIIYSFRVFALDASRVVYAIDHWILNGIIDALGVGTVGYSRELNSFDDSVLDGSVNAVADSLKSTGNSFKFLVSGNLHAYAAGIVLGIVALLILVRLMGM